MDRLDYLCWSPGPWGFPKDQVVGNLPNLHQKDAVYWSLWDYPSALVLGLCLSPESYDRNWHVDVPWEWPANASSQSASSFLCVNIHLYDRDTASWPKSSVGLRHQCNMVCQASSHQIHRPISQTKLILQGHSVSMREVRHYVDPQSSFDFGYMEPWPSSQKFGKRLNRNVQLFLLQQQWFLRSAHSKQNTMFYHSTMK